MVTPEQARKIAESLEDEAEVWGENNYVEERHAAQALRDLASQVESLQADAERYNWILENARTGSIGLGLEFVLYPGDEKSYVDAAIDAARKQS